MMNQQEILRKIGNIIQELHDQHQYLNQTSKINLLELELFSANADFLANHLEILKKLTLQDDVFKALDAHPSESKLIIESIIEKPLIDQQEFSTSKKEVVEIEHKDKPVVDFSFEDKTNEMVFDFENETPIEVVSDTEFNVENKELLEDKSKTVEEVNEVFTDEEEDGPEPFLLTKEQETEAFIPIREVTTVKDEKSKAVFTPEIKEAKLTLNEILSSKLDQKKEVNNGSNIKVDLKTAISLNDKMIFIKDLFNGYNLAYSEAVEILNRLESFETADNFLTKNYAKKNDWVNKQDLVDRLYEYLNRRFGA